MGNNYSTAPSPSNSGENDGDPEPETPESPAEKNSSQDHLKDEEIAEGEEDEEGECSFCVFMKRGACKELFIEWNKCLEECEKKEEAWEGKCLELNAALVKCMEKHSDYYFPDLLAAAAASAAGEESEMEEEKVKGGNNSTESGV